MNYGQIQLHPERVSNIKLFINKYKWKGINIPSKIDDWKTFKKNYPTTALNILHIKEKEMSSLYFKNYFELRKTDNSINDSKRMIPSWHYLAIKKLSALLRGIRSKHHGNFYYLNYLHSFATKSKLKIS